MFRQVCKKRILIRFLLLASVSIGIFWLSLTSSPPTFQAPIIGWDKAQHALAYGVLAFFAGLFFSLCQRIATHAWKFACIYAIGFGGLLEILQAVAGTGRTCEWGDLFADAFGALIGCRIGAWIQKNRRS